MGSIVFAMTVVGCSTQSSEVLLVSAAASLTDVFAEIEEGFESENPGVDVVLNLGATSTLARQLLEGAPADVFASADVANMDSVLDASLAEEAAIFAFNGLEIAVGEGNPTGVEGLAALADEQRAVGLCAPTVPCGRLAREALGAAGVAPSLDSEEPNVRALLAKIAIGELDVGIVYRTDVVAEDRVEGISISDPVNVVNQYAIAAMSGSDQPESAARFVEYVLSPAGGAVLGSAGFGLP